MAKRKQTIQRAARKRKAAQRARADVRAQKKAASTGESKPARPKKVAKAEKD